MIVTRELVPSVYYNESRDFQILGRTFEVLFNYIKTNVDMVNELPFSRNSDIKLLPLLATTLGFSTKRNYDVTELRALCACFAELLKHKGTKYSIELAVGLLLNAHHIDEFYDVEIDRDDSHNFIIYIPKELYDTTLLEDIFDYILPSGFTYKFINAAYGTPYHGALVGFNDRVVYQAYSTLAKEAELGLISNTNALSGGSGTNLDNISITSNTITPTASSISSFGVVVTPTSGEEESE